MKEYMLFIKGTGNPAAQFSEEQRESHIGKVGKFIQDLVGQGKVKLAQPLEPAGMTLSFGDGSFTEEDHDSQEEAILGYYHILASDLDEAKTIAKSDPRFEDGIWKIEVRPVLKVEGIN